MSLIYQPRHAATSRRRAPRAVGVTAAAAALSLVLGGLAAADMTYVDGDSASAGVQNGDLTATEACAVGTGVHTSHWTVPVYARRNGNLNSGNVWANSALLNVTSAFQGPTTPTGALSQTLPSPAQIQLDSNWQSEANNTLNGPVNATITANTTGLNLGDAITGTVSYTLSTNPSTYSDSQNVGVNLSVVDATTGLEEDCVLPTVSITTPATGTPQYDQNDTVAAAFSCDDQPYGTGLAPASGVDTCTGKVDGTTTVNNGNNLPTADLGTHTLVVTATDNAGNTKSASRDYEVIAPVHYSLIWGAPIDKPSTINVAKYGKVIPVKAKISDGTNAVTSGVVYLETSKVNCGSSDPTDSVETYAAGSSNTGNQFRWDSTGQQWIYNLNTGAFTGVTLPYCFRGDLYVGGTVDSSTGKASGGTFVDYFLAKLTK